MNGPTVGLMALIGILGLFFTLAYFGHQNSLATERKLTTCVQSGGSWLDGNCVMPGVKK